MNSSEDGGLVTLEVPPPRPLALAAGGGSLHWRAGPCPPWLQAHTWDRALHLHSDVLHSVSMCSCCTDKQGDPAAHIPRSCSYACGLSIRWETYLPRYRRSWPSRSHQSSHGLLMESALLLYFLCGHHAMGDPFQGAEKQDVSNK